MEPTAPAAEYSTIVRTEHTPHRVYTVTRYNKTGLYVPEYQSRNPKTGKPWQAKLTIARQPGWGFVYGTRNDGGHSEFVLGKFDADAMAGKWQWMSYGYISEEDAVAAVAAEIKRSHK